MTQLERVANHLQEHGSITSMEAFEQYGITRLSAKVFDLRKQGMDISMTRTKCKNRYGDEVYYGVYRLETD